MAGYHLWVAVFTSYTVIIACQQYQSPELTSPSTITDDSDESDDCGPKFIEATFTSRTFRFRPITSGFDSKNIICQWIFNSTATGFSVEITDQPFYTDSSISMFAYDGYGKDNRMIPWKQVIRSSGPYLTIILQAESNTHLWLIFTYKQIKVNKECEDTKIATHTVAHITTPRYPMNYNTLIDCFWLITSHSRHARIRIFIINFDLAINDVALIWDGPSESNSILGRIESRNISFLSSSNQVYIMFHSDETLTGKGFSLAYSSENYQECQTFPIVASSKQLIETTYFNNTSSTNETPCQWQINHLRQVDYRSVTIEVLELNSWTNLNCVDYYLEALTDNNQIFMSHLCEGSVITIPGSDYVILVLKNRSTLRPSVNDVGKVTLRVIANYDDNDPEQLPPSQAPMSASIFGVGVGLAPLLCFCFLIFGIVRKRRARSSRQRETIVNYQNQPYSTPMTAMSAMQFYPSPPSYEEVTKNDTVDPPAYETIAGSNINQTSPSNTTGVPGWGYNLHI